MKSPEYADFDLELSAGTDGGYVARVLSSPRGEASAEVTMPFQGAELENVILRLGRTRSGVRSLNSPQAKLARSFGTALFDAVFAGEVGTTFARSLDDTDTEGTGLRVRLRLAGVPELADIPWEYLYSGSLGRFIVLSGDTPVVRYLDLPRRVAPLRVSPPLRILLVISAPHDLAALDHSDESARMRDVLGDLIRAGSVVIEPLARPTLAGLRQALRRGEYHVLHFIGHGGFDASAGDGVLAFEDEHQRSHLVSGADLGTLLHDHRTLRLAVLNACEGARQSPTDPFSGVAQSLVRQGLPAVVAMQFEITDAAALVFGQEFYAAIADGYPVDAALAQARLAVFSSDNDVEWGTPVLYLRARDGRIFDLPRDAQAAPPTAAGVQATPAVGVQATPTVGVETTPTIVRKPAPLSLQDDPDYSRALAAFFTQRWDDAVELLTVLSVRHPGDSGLSTRLAEAKKQRDLVTWDVVARKAAEQGDWDAAVASLERLANAGQDQPDLQDRLAQARRHQQVSGLVRDLRALHAASAWNAVLAVADQIAALDPEAADPDGLATRAREELAQAELAGDYATALRHLDQQDWGQATEVLTRVQERDPEYLESAALLRRAKVELHAAKGRAAEERNRWNTALLHYRQVLRLDPDHRDIQRRLHECELARDAEFQAAQVQRAQAEAQAEAQTAASAVTTAPTDEESPLAPPDLKLEIGQWPAALAVSPDGQRLAIGCRKWVQLWDLQERTLVWKVAGGGWIDTIRAVAFSPDGLSVAAAACENVKVWDAATGSKDREFPHGGGSAEHSALAFGPDDTIVVATDSKTTRILNAQTGEKLRSFQHDSFGLAGQVCFSADGRILAVAKGDTVSIYDTQAMQLVRRITAAGASHLALTPDGETLAIVAGVAVQVLDVDTATTHFEGKTLPVGAVTFDADGARLLIGTMNKNVVAIDVGYP